MEACSILRSLHGFHRDRGNGAHREGRGAGEKMTVLDILHEDSRQHSQIGRGCNRALRHHMKNGRRKIKNDQIRRLGKALEHGPSQSVAGLGAGDQKVLIVDVETEAAVEMLVRSPGALCSGTKLIRRKRPEAEHTSYGNRGKNTVVKYLVVTPVRYTLDEQWEGACVGEQHRPKHESRPSTDTGSRSRGFPGRCVPGFGCLSGSLEV